MSTARHHAEWLSLVEASGPFLSMPVLLEAFPQGLDAHDPELLRSLRLAFEEWEDNQQGLRPDPAIHRAWVEFVLQEVLEFPDEVLLSGQQIPTGLSVDVAEHQDRLRPDWVVYSHPDPLPSPLPQGEGVGEGVKPRLLIQVVPAGQDLDKPLAGKRWKASPATRMMELLHSCNVRLGLVTNGDRWMLVNAPRGETTGFISWYANLWLEEHITLRAFRSLLGVRRFFVEEPNLEALLGQSVNSQQEVTDQLGYQVRKAVEVLVQALDRIDGDRNGTLLAGISESQLYEAALTVMMRLVFLFSAEEKGLLLLGDELYDQCYAVSTLRSQLREVADQQGEEILQYRHDGWCRLLATFRAVYAGIRHDALQLPAYGGDLFDPDRFPFLEGRPLGKSWQTTPSNPIPINNRTVLHLLEALQLLQVKVPGGGIEPRRLSFRALDIEQIGHVYEGLLDHTAVRAMSTVLGLIGTKDKEPEVALVDLEKAWEKGEEEVVGFLKKVTGRSVSALRKALRPHPLIPSPSGRGESPVGGLSSVVRPHPLVPSPSGRGGGSVGGLSSMESQRLLIACNNDTVLFNRVLPFAQLIRFDTFDYPIVIPEGSVYVTQGSDRRETGTHYTPRSLTEEIVRYTLEPLVYRGVVEGKPKEQWRLKSAAELLQLKVCDMAMGSGAFLVQACRYLAERLVEAWEGLELHSLTSSRRGRGAKKYVVVTPEGELSQAHPQECLIPTDADERLIVAKRIVAERCLYGVDKNPLAVEMAKLSLWLETLQKSKPFTFLDHALKCGDSLVGVSLAQLRCWNLDTSSKILQLDVGSDRILREVEEAIALRLQIEAKPVTTSHDQQEKAFLLTQANARIKDLRDRANQLIYSYFAQGTKSEQEALRQRLLWVAKGEADVSERDRAVLPREEELRPFHWELEFPEVFSLTPALSLTLTPALSLRERELELELELELERERELESERGFHALIGNPPFMGGQKITGALSTEYRDFLVEWIANGKRGSADICAYFFLRGQKLLRQDGGLGLLATNTIAQGDTREVGLDQLVAQGCIIPRAVPSRKWPGTASIEVAHVWLRQGNWQSKFILDEKPVEGITSFLTIPGKAVGKPHRLAANQDKSFIGSYVLGMGFILTPEEAQALIEKDTRNQDVLFPYLI
ncbi:Eco57I restriction-modification methylase domain-containing protein [Coleofasciculus chthonoplastes]|uniref:Eco57I restriction-modification methylase domain-containing protein n=1 Tax=Coleofasciculus chthonoplastes TaxID=64178 RepID=UPI003304C10F